MLRHHVFINHDVSKPRFSFFDATVLLQVCVCGPWAFRGERRAKRVLLDINVHQRVFFIADTAIPSRVVPLRQAVQLYLSLFVSGSASPLRPFPPSSSLQLERRYQIMASVDPRPSPRPPLEPSSPPPSASRMAHSRQMSSLSMNTFTSTSQSHHPSEPLLRSTEAHQGMLSPPLHPAALYVGRPPRFFFWFRYQLMISFSSGLRKGAIGRGLICGVCANGACSGESSCRSWVGPPALFLVNLTLYVI